MRRYYTEIFEKIIIATVQWISAQVRI